jgi:hypothetical protein
LHRTVCVVFVAAAASVARNAILMPEHNQRDQRKFVLNGGDDAIRMVNGYLISESALGHEGGGRFNWTSPILVAHHGLLVRAQCDEVHVSSVMTFGGVRSANDPENDHTWPFAVSQA